MVTTRMLATDLDGTFIGDDIAMEELWRELEAKGVLVVFSTGRHLASIEDFYARAATQHRARACVAMVGTEIWYRRGDGYELDVKWRGMISEGWDKRRVEAIVGEYPEVVLQPDEWQSPLKSSFFLHGDVDGVVEEIGGRFTAAGVAAKVVHSAGRFLDVLPARSGKGPAVSLVARELGVAPHNVVTAGDTGNDLDMMRPELGFRSVVVGNATPELRHYVAPDVYHATAWHAAGIREGLEHFGWL